jgi:precorrin-2/cobalt-factor-2 C20-methyltransferase
MDGGAGMKKGILYGVGVGPGDPGLMTVKAVNLIKSCDILAIPHRKTGECFAYRIAVQEVPEVKEKPVLSIDMPMTHDKAVREAAYKAGADLIAEELSQGKKVVFLTLGDPAVYSTFAYLAPQVRDRGFEVVWIPGVTSFCAAAAALGEPLCTDREALHILPGGVDAEDVLQMPGTKVFMKGELSPLLDALRERNQDAQAVENCGIENEHIYKAADAIPEDAGYYLVTIVKEKEA